MFALATPNEIERYIRKIRSNVAAGVDEFKPLPIKYIPTIVGPILCHIGNRMLDTSISSERLIVAKVISIHKCGDGHFRPIFVLPIFSKRFEGIINTRLTQVLQNTKLYLRFSTVSKNINPRKVRCFV